MIKTTMEAIRISKVEVTLSLHEGCVFIHKAKIWLTLIEDVSHYVLPWSNGSRFSDGKIDIS